MYLSSSLQSSSSSPCDRKHSKGPAVIELGKSQSVVRKDFHLVHSEVRGLCADTLYGSLGAVLSFPSTSPAQHLFGGLLHLTWTLLGVSVPFMLPTPPRSPVPCCRAQQLPGNPRAPAPLT